MDQRILVAVDGSPTSQRGLEKAVHLARLTGEKLRLMHCIDDPLRVSLPAASLTIEKV
ncbi:universal stress protein [uncultured Ramlibacter sp.]|mgnify:CR=1 FL=1|uniref:universal stress protein n=1 Tax=uncultured Ramlibacter sp. TaxID=260755 RepID=UPI00263439CF|nr:universal stress protein [uncultured Ramlibacter sp.]